MNHHHMLRYASNHFEIVLADKVAPRCSQNRDIGNGTVKSLRGLQPTFEPHCQSLHSLQFDRSLWRTGRTGKADCFCDVRGRHIHGTGVLWCDRYSYDHQIANAAPLSATNRPSARNCSSTWRRWIAKCHKPWSRCPIIWSYLAHRMQKKRLSSGSNDAVTDQVSISCGAAQRASRCNACSMSAATVSGAVKLTYGGRLSQCP